MTDFSERFIALRDSIEASLESAFTQTRSADCLGRVAALRADYTIEGERKLFGIMSTGRVSHCHEFRLLFATPSLDDVTLADWWGYAQQLQQELVHADIMHEYSLISVILVTDALDRATEKKLKRLQSEKRYDSETSNGWSSVRIAVIDLSRRKAFSNALGTPLRDLLKKHL